MGQMLALRLTYLRRPLLIRGDGPPTGGPSCGSLGAGFFGDPVQPMVGQSFYAEITIGSGHVTNPVFFAKKLVIAIKTTAFKASYL